MGAGRWTEARVGSGSSGYGIGGGAGEGRTLSGLPSGSLDGGFMGGADHQHSISENLDDVKSDYDFEDGYFGDEAASEDKRHIYSDDPLATARDFYERIGYGGIEEPLPGGKGVKVTMSDGTVISFREVSESDGTPVVQVSIRRSTDSAGVEKQKIHFEMEKDE